LLRFHCVQAQFIQESLDGAFTAFKRSLSKNLWMALSLRSSAAYPRIFGWRFHFVQAQFIQESLDGAFTLFKRSLSKNLWMALSLCSSAASRIGLTQSPLKTAADFLHLGQ
jgi:hypothetical protein